MTPDPSKLLRRVRQLIPAIAASAAEGARERRVPPTIIAALKEAGVFRALQPKRWGGYELAPTALYALEMAVGEGDMSTAWLVGVLGIIPWAVALFDDRAAEEVWGSDDSTLICCALRRAGTATPVEGGFRLSGRWRYASGCAHAGWALLGGGAGPPPDGDYLMLVPRREFELLDTWHVAGLKATGSHDVVVKDVFIPQYRAHRMVDLFDCKGPGQKTNHAPLYRMPFGLVFAGGVANAAVGALQGMLNRILEDMRARGGPSRPDPDLSLVCAEAATTIDEARIVIERNFARLAAHAERSAIPPIEERLQVKYQLSLNTERCRVAANRLLEATGASGLYDTHPYGRIIADITAGRQHITNNVALHARDWGQVMLGQPRRHDFML
jgi:3-hydroxy-9,10-secoandrosta-1,3,5(10)-triene-9,17-dione monooxygenase